MTCDFCKGHGILVYSEEIYEEPCPKCSPPMTDIDDTEQEVTLTTLITRLEKCIEALEALSERRR